MSNPIFRLNPYMGSTNTNFGAQYSIAPDWGIASTGGLPFGNTDSAFPFPNGLSDFSSSNSSSGQPGFFSKGFSSSPKGQAMTRGAGWANAGIQAVNAIAGASGSGTNKVGNALSSIGGMVGSIPTPYTAIAGAVLSGIGTIANGFTNNVNEEHVKAISNQINNISGITSNANNYNDLQNDYDLLATQHVDLGDLSSWGDKGFFISDHNSKRSRARKTAQDALEVAQMQAVGNLQDRGNIINQNNFANQYARLNAFGGDLMTNGATWDNGFTYVGNGGSHEANPNEGVQVGVDPQGIPNLVEEGEVIWNDYVFSKRLKVPKAFRDKYKFKDGGELSFADAAKKFAEENKERPNDPISKRGRDAMLTTLMDTQEEVRMKKQAREAKAQFNALAPEEQLGIMQMAQQNAMQGGPEGDMNMMSGYPQQEYPQEQVPEQFAEGGTMGNLFAGTGEESQKMSKAVRRRGDQDWFTARARALGIPVTGTTWDNFIKDFSLTDASANLSNFNSIYAEAQREKALNNYVNAHIKDWQNEALNSGLYRRSGDGKYVYKANIYDAPVGDYIGTNGSYLDTKAFNEKKAAYDAAMKLKEDKRSEEQKALITEMESQQYKPISWAHNVGDLKRNYDGTVDYGTTDISTSDEWLKPKDYTADFDKTWDANKAAKIAYDPENSKSWQSYLRYAPALCGAIGLMTDVFSKPDYSRAQEIKNAGSYEAPLISAKPIGNYLAYRPFDVNYYANKTAAQTRATARALQQQSAGNQAQAMAGLLALDYNNTNAMGDLFRKAEEYNLEQRAKVADFNRATDMFNSQQALTADRANQAARQQALRDRYTGVVAGNSLMDTIDARRSASMTANLTNIFNSLGQIGEEAYDRDRLNALIERGVLQDLYKNKNACGGMLTKKRKKGGK